MTGIFPKELSAENFRSLDRARIPLRVPNGSRGSGLNLFIGENGSGKTSAIQLLHLAFQGNQARLRTMDFVDIDKQIVAEVSLDRFKVIPGNAFKQQKKEYFESTGLRFTAESRLRRQPRRLISDQFSARTLLIADEFYLDKNDLPVSNVSGEYGKFDRRDLALDLDRIPESKLAAPFILERSRARHLGRGQFTTTLERICDEMSWHFRKSLRGDALRESQYNQAFRSLEGEISKSVPKEFGEVLTQEFSRLLDFGISIAPLCYDEPFESACFTKKGQKETRGIPEIISLTRYVNLITPGIPVDMIGSGHEMIAALVLQIYLAEYLNAPLLLLIDEPEMHLHPRIQTRLGEYLIEKSAHHQVILTSHSPYLVREVGAHAYIVHFILNNGATEVRPAAGLTTRLPRGLTVNEVNFLAFGFISFDYLNELWGAAMTKFKIDQVMDLDRVLQTAGLSASETWIKNGGQKANVTLPTFVRNSLHHPENKNNRMCKEVDIEAAIIKLRGILQQA